MQIVKKLSVGLINALRSGFKDVKDITLVARIYGLVSGVEAKDQTTGVVQKFTGEFRAVNQKGEVFASPVCYLPSPADAQLEAALKAAKGKQIKFAYDIFVAPAPAGAPLKYEYKIKPLIETGPSDVLADMSATLPEFVAPVAAPVAATETPAATQEAHKANGKKK